MRSAGAAGRDRQTDVYVGVDVFGRGCFGGGGYNCNKVHTVYCSLFFPVLGVVGKVLSLVPNTHLHKMIQCKAKLLVRWLQAAIYFSP